jgi:AcrR family transcriptional regulator
MPSRGPYRLKARADRQAAVRLRITEATVELHSTVGPARTTISAVAQQAGVDRLTVYRHFPTRRELFEACSSHARQLHPMPDPDIWAGILDPEHRFEAALATLYAYYENNEGLLMNVLRDAEIEPLVGELSAPRRAYLARVTDLLSTGWQARGRRRTILLSAVAHALEFFTWNSLVRGRGLTSTEAADVMLAAVRCLEPVQRTSRRGRRAASAP